jgi:hypothetical protein
MSKRSAAPLVMKGIAWIGFIVDLVEVISPSLPRRATTRSSGSSAIIAPLCLDSTIAPRLTSTNIGISSLI